MITINDCEAFCDADPVHVLHLARDECLGMVQAYAQAHESTKRAGAPVTPGDPSFSFTTDNIYRRAA